MNRDINKSNLESIASSHNNGHSNKFAENNSIPEFKLEVKLAEPLNSKVHY